MSTREVPQPETGGIRMCPVAPLALRHGSPVLDQRAVGPTHGIPVWEGTRSILRSFSGRSPGRPRFWSQSGQAARWASMTRNPGGAEIFVGHPSGQHKHSPGRHVERRSLGAAHVPDSLPVAPPEETLKCVGPHPRCLPETRLGRSAWRDPRCWKTSHRRRTTGPVPRGIEAPRLRHPGWSWSKGGNPELA